MNRLVLTVLLIMLASSAWAVRFTLTDLGSLGGSSVAYGINDSGTVVGKSVTADGTEHAFAYYGGTMHDINGSLGGSNWSCATAINGSGQIAGNFGSADFSHAFIYSNGAVQDLGTLGGSSSHAVSINSHGQVVGYSSTATGATNAFLYSNGTMQDLGTLGGFGSTASAINNSGQIVGSFTTSWGDEHAFLYSNGTMYDLNDIVNVPDWTLTYAFGINDTGAIVGAAVNSSGERNAFLYDGTFHSLGLLDGCWTAALGINNMGQIIGMTYSAWSNGGPIFYDGAMHDLSSLVGLSLFNATGINNNGQIIANAYRGEGSTQQYAILMTPIPEPTSLLALVAGLVPLAGLAIRRKK